MVKRFVAFALLLGLVVATAGFVWPPAKVSLLVGFVEQVDQRVVLDLGGKVQHQFQNFPVALVSLEETSIPSLMKNNRVAFVERDQTWHAISQSLPWGVDRIDAEKVFSGTTTGNGVKVAIIDTGIDTGHSDLKVYGGYNFVANNTNFNDDNGHGTHVAGTVAAVNNTIGVVGVAPEALLYGVKVLDSGGSGSWSNIAKGIDWSISNGMKVINMSLGGSQSSSTLEQACQRAWDAGVLIVAAAGNSGKPSGKGDNVNYPAKYSTVIAVAATNPNDSRASFSSTGPAVEIAAPGRDIPSTYMGNTYKTLSGTSMASPHVAGVAALIWHTNPGFTNQNVRDALTRTAIDLGATGRDPQFGHGLVYAPNAINYKP